MHSNRFILKSRRLGFRLIEHTDFEKLVELDMDPEVRAYFPFGTSSQQQTRERIERNRINFVEKGYCDFTVVHKDSGRFVGRSGFSDIAHGEIEVGYVLIKEFWGGALRRRHRQRC